MSVPAWSAPEELDAGPGPAPERRDGGGTVPVRDEFQREADRFVGADQVGGRVDAVASDLDAAPAPWLPNT
ncbi:hypothetical protein [Streptomyces sp. NPDC001076]